MLVLRKAQVLIKHSRLASPQTFERGKRKYTYQKDYGISSDQSHCIVSPGKPGGMISLYIASTRNAGFNDSSYSYVVVTSCM